MSLPLLFRSQQVKKQLTIELVPATSWFNNARKILSKGQWDIVRKATYKAASYVCEICGGQGPKWPVECHEIWTFDDDTHVQKLGGLQALCPDCHMVKHYGFAQIKKLEHVAFAHLCKVNDWNPEQGRTYVKSAFQLWDKRSRSNWIVNIDVLDKFGIDVPALEHASAKHLPSDIREHDIID